jgi:hypothetical protein
MTDFEDQLRRALARQEPSAGFADRVVARAAKRRPAPWANWRAWTAAAIAACLCLGALDLEMEHQRKVRAQGEAARAQLIQAMQITSAKLHKIQKKVRGSS